jgi:hypothetical protein
MFRCTSGTTRLAKFRTVTTRHISRKYAWLVHTVLFREGPLMNPSWPFPTWRIRPYLTSLIWKVLNSTRRTSIGVARHNSRSHLPPTTPPNGPSSSADAKGHPLSVNPEFQRPPSPPPKSPGTGRPKSQTRFHPPPVSQQQPQASRLPSSFLQISYSCAGRASGTPHAGLAHAVGSHRRV